MEALAQPPRCRTCSAILQPPGHMCGACHTVQHVQAQSIIQPLMPLKSKGIAVLLTFFWLGAGHFYADKIGMGIVLAVVDLFLVLIAMTGIGIIIAFPIWVIMFVIASLLSVSAVEQFNTVASTPFVR